MTSGTIQVEPLWILPPHRVGPRPQTAGVPVIEAIPPLERPSGYPHDLIVARAYDPNRRLETVWHGGPGIVVDAYV